MDALEILTSGHQTATEAIARLRPDDWLRPGALGTWSAKDIVGHLGAFEVRFADALAPFAGAEARTTLLDAPTSTFNDDQAAIRMDWTVTEVLEEFEAAAALVMDLARRVAPERWREPGTIPWYGLEYSLDDLVVYQMYGHKREHTPQIEAAAEVSASA